MTELATSASPTPSLTLRPVDARADLFDVELDDAWSSLVGVHGGHLTSVAIEAAHAGGLDRPVRTIATTFLRSAVPGPATAEVRTVRAGGSITIAEVAIAQAGHGISLSRLTLMDARSGPEWSSVSSLELPPPGDCVPRDPTRPLPRHFERAEARFDPANPPLDNDRARVRGYLRPLPGEKADAAWLAMASDWFPPPAFSVVDPPVGGISIDLFTHLHRTEVELGPDDWLVGDFAIEVSAAGMAVEHGRLQTRAGEVVAESIQTRLTATR